MAPEVILNKPHGPGIDYFALGVIALECCLGLGAKPYYGKDRKYLKEAVKI